MIYVTMTLSVLVIELMHMNVKKYASFKLWASERWDNLAVSFVSGVLLCLGFPDIANMPAVMSVVDIHEYPSLGGIIIGLSSTPLINYIKSLTKERLVKKK